MQSNGRHRQRITTERRVWYLMLYHWVPTRRYDEDDNFHFQIIHNECKKVRITIRRLYVHWREREDTNGRYLFRFRYYKKDDALAIRLAESFLYGLSLMGGVSTMLYDDSLVLRVPDSIVVDREYVYLDDLVTLEKGRAPEDRMLVYPEMTLSTIGGTTSDRFEAAWRIACTTFDNQALFDASCYLKRSHDFFYIFPGGLDEALSDSKGVALTSSDQSRFEDGLQNSFKAIEAVIGDPPKSDNKLFFKLKGIGLDPNEMVGYRDKKALYKVIRDMNVARDRKSAHGGTPNRTIYIQELLDFQTCSEMIVIAAIEHVRGSAVLG
ncbi:hypothetical protein KA005_54980 [bacterium]|nr:hypothetical protein [bacterium]